MKKISFSAWLCILLKLSNISLKGCRRPSPSSSKKQVTESERPPTAILYDRSFIFLSSVDQRPIHGRLHGSEKVVAGNDEEVYIAWALDADKYPHNEGNDAGNDVKILSFNESEGNEKRDKQTENEGKTVQDRHISFKKRAETEITARPQRKDSYDRQGKQPPFHRGKI